MSYEITELAKVISKAQKGPTVTKNFDQGNLVDVKIIFKPNFLTSGANNLGNNFFWNRYEDEISKFI